MKVLLIMYRKCFAVAVVYFIVLTYSEIEVFAKTEKDLWLHLFEAQAYDKLFRPVKNPKTAVPVTVGLTPLEIIYENKYNIQKVGAWLIVTWKDEYLTWDPNDFENIEQLILPISKVWSPDLTLYTSKVDSPFLTNVTTNVIIRFDGELTWIILDFIHTQCSYIGETKCEISIMSRSYDESLMEMGRPVNQSLTHFKDGGYRLASLDTSKELTKFSWSKNDYAIINFTLKLKDIR